MSCKKQWLKITPHINKKHVNSLVVYVVAIVNKSFSRRNTEEHYIERYHETSSTNSVLVNS